MELGRKQCGNLPFLSHKKENSEFSFKNTLPTIFNFYFALKKGRFLHWNFGGIRLHRILRFGENFINRFFNSSSGKISFLF